MGEPLVSAIVVSYNVAGLLRRCLASLEGELAASGLGGELLVVDNASSDGSAELVRSEFPMARLIANPLNLGFARASNQAGLISRGRYLLFLNPDTELLPGSLATMVCYLDGRDDVAAVGPALLNSDGTVQGSLRRFPTPGTLLLESTPLQRLLPRAALLSRFYCWDLSPEREQEPGWLVGACFLVRRAAIEQVGWMDEDFFMYFEEQDWFYRMRRAGWRVVYLPQARVLHHYGRSSQQDAASRHIHFNASKCRLAEKRFGPLFASFLRLYLLGTFCYQAGEEVLKLALGHKPALRRERISQYLRVLASGLRA